LQPAKAPVPAALPAVNTIPTWLEEAMRRSSICLGLAAIVLLACGRNQVTVQIRGGDGNLVRLDANALEYKYDRLQPAGRTDFPSPGSKLEVKKGTYAVHVVASGYLATQNAVVGSPPLAGTRTYPLTFDIPPGRNGAYAVKGTIVFAATPTSVRNWDLFTIQADGSGLRRLTDTREFEQHPRWSPDGTKIVYTEGDVMTNIDIWVMDADGGNRRRLTDQTERDQRACWSPDGRQIAFTSQRQGTVDIWLMDADGGNQRRLTYGREPSWSPDGRRIVFTCAQHEGWDEIYTIDVDGQNLQRLTVDKGKFDMFPAWCPDGARIVFDTERFGGQELMVMLADGSAQARITVAENTYESEPAWSPDGLAVVYSGKMNLDANGQVLRDSTGRPLGAPDIFIVGATGFDWDNCTERLVRPVNLTQTPDWEEASPSWRAY